MRRGANYIAEDFTVVLPAVEYIKGYLDAPRIIGYCKECRQYGRSWACPPFEHKTQEELERYQYVKLLAIKITPTEEGIPLTESQAFLRPERTRAEKLLRSWEAEQGGRAFAYAGECLYCPSGTCTRPEGLPCRYPELVRPSLEAYGFDIVRTTSELFGIELQWSTDGNLPEYLTLVSGLFYPSAASDTK